MTNSRSVGTDARTKKKRREGGATAQASHLNVLSKAALSGPPACVSEREPPAHLLHLISEGLQCCPCVGSTPNSQFLTHLSWFSCGTGKRKKGHTCEDMMHQPVAVGLGPSTVSSSRMANSAPHASMPRVYLVCPGVGWKRGERACLPGSLVSSIVTLYSKHTGALTSENFCQHSH